MSDNIPVNVSGTETDKEMVKIDNGKLDAFGLGISISDIIGDKIIDAWFAQLTPEDMNLIFKAIENEIFSHNYNDEKFFKTTVETKSSYWSNTSYEDTPIWKTTKNAFAKKYNEIILSKVDEILSSKAYQDKANKIAEEIVEYATEGYKTDMMKRVRERMIDNVIDAEPTFDQASLRSVIRSVVSEMFPANLINNY